MVEGDRLASRALIGGEDLGVGHPIVAADDQVAHGCATYVLHLLDATLVHDGGPFLATLDLEAREHHSSILTSCFHDMLMVSHKVLLELDEVYLIRSRAED